jgi:hypothetical protein
MSFNYKNPISPISVLGNESVSRTDVFGTDFSVLGTGGYMEVFSLNDLIFTVPTGTLGLVEFSGNTIPIQLNIGNGAVFSPNVLTLNSDNISSGRRRIGMLVYVIEENQVYQYQVPNFTSLWNSATGSTGPGGNTVVFSNFGTTIKNNSVSGQNLINAWSGSTIEGVSGGTRTNSNWVKYYGNDLSVTGGSFSNITNVLTLTNITGGTIPITGFTSFDRAISAYTYDNANTFIIDDNSGNTYTATINIVTGLTVNGDLTITGNTISDGFTANTISAATYQNLPINPDTYITGFTYSANTFTISDNSGTTFNSTIDIVTGLTVNGDLTVTGNTTSDGLTANTISAATYQNLPIDPDTYITGFTYSANTFTISDNSGNTYNATINDVTGLTVNGNLTVTGTSSSTLFSGITFSGGTYYGDGSNLSGITDYYTTGATFNPITKIGTFTRNDGISYTLNLSALTTVDTYVTGFTSSGATLTINQNEGRPPLSTTIPTLSLSGALSSVTFNIVTTGSISATTFSGGTFIGNGSGIFNAPYLPISGGTVTGSTQFTNGLTANTISATTYQNLPIDPDTYITGFTYSANTFTIYDNSGNTYNATINDVTGLTINGNLSVTGTSQLDGGISSLSFTGMTNRIIQTTSGGTLVSVDIYISSGSTAATDLSTTSNWDINGNYIGPVITGTTQGQKWYDSNYFYEAVQDNIFIRLIRG